MKLIHNANRIEVICTFDEKHIPKSAHFRWDPKARRWWTDDLDKALKLKRIRHWRTACRVGSVSSREAVCP